MKKVSIDMSKPNNENTAGNRIFGEAYDIQDDTTLCEFTSANYDFDSTKKIAELKKLLSDCVPYIEYHIIREKHFGFTPNSAELLRKVKEVIEHDKSNDNF